VNLRGGQTFREAVRDSYVPKGHGRPVPARYGSAVRPQFAQWHPGIRAAGVYRRRIIRLPTEMYILGGSDRVPEQLAYQSLLGQPGMPEKDTSIHLNDNSQYVRDIGEREARR
jgi:hypothetical protein